MENYKYSKKDENAAIYFLVSVVVSLVLICVGAVTIVKLIINSF